MASRHTHVIVSLIFILFIWFIAGSRFLSVFTGWTFLYSWFLFFIGSLAPDYIEPAYNFKHRSFFHSWKLLKIISISAVVMFIIWLIFKLPPFLYVFAFLLGYIGHLLLDSTTKMGLPSGERKINLTEDKKFIKN
jgi:hypothetical protein